jgi:uncharacterized protein YvpB
MWKFLRNFLKGWTAAFVMGLVLICARPAQGAESYQVMGLAEAVTLPDTLFLGTPTLVEDLEAFAASRARMLLPPQQREAEPPLRYSVYQYSDFLADFSDKNAAIAYAAQYSHGAVVAEGRLYAEGAALEAPALDAGTFTVRQYRQPLGDFDLYAEAVAYADLWDHNDIVGRLVVWHNYGPLPLSEFKNLSDAIQYAKTEEEASAVVAAGAEVWREEVPIGSTKILDVPFTAQMPELPRGCEVTSLALLLNHQGVDVSKMELAEKIKKSPLQYDDPNNGFVGDMYTYKNHGYGVYHEPIYELARDYLPEQALDLTGCAFEDLLYYLDRGQPVWVITNSRFRALPASEFITWQTPSGAVRVTYREHSVLVVGYDTDRIYFHDPLTGAYRQAPRRNFVAGWEQMGRQAVACAV